MKGQISFNSQSGSFDPAIFDVSGFGITVQSEKKFRDLERRFARLKAVYKKGVGNLAVQLDCGEVCDGWIEPSFELEENFKFGVRHSTSETKVFASYKLLH